MKKDIPESIASFISMFNALHAELDAYSGNFCWKFLIILSASTDWCKSKRQRANLHTYIKLYLNTLNTLS